MKTNMRRYERSFFRRTVAVALLAAVLAGAGAASAAGTGLVDLNTATLEQLQDLPGIGPSKAQAILDERKNGKFTSVDDLERVRGIGPALMAQLRERVTTGAEQPK